MSERLTGSKPHSGAALNTETPSALSTSTDRERDPGGTCSLRDINKLSKNNFVTFILNQLIQRPAENGPQNDQEAHDFMHRRESRTEIQFVTRFV